MTGAALSDTRDPYGDGTTEAVCDCAGDTSCCTTAWTNDCVELAEEWCEDIGCEDRSARASSHGAPPATSHVTQARHPFYLAGRAVDAGDLLPVADKYSGQVVSHAVLADRSAILAGIAAAFAARPAMRAFPPYARRAVLRQCVEKLSARQAELATLLAIEAGKPIRDARGEVTRLIDTFEVAAEEAVRIDGEVVNLEISPRAKGYRGFTKRVPDRRLLVHHAVQLPAQPGRAQGRPRHRRGLPVRPQAVGADTSRRAHPRRDPRRDRLARRGVLRAPRTPRRRGPASSRTHASRSSRSPARRRSAGR